MALAADRGSAGGLKQACNGFQSAAGAFALLREGVAPKLAASGGGTVDLSVECAGMLERLMLAQVIGDEKPPGICSKVARQVCLRFVLFREFVVEFGFICG